MRLDVRVVGAEQLLRTVARQVLDDVHILAAAVISRSRITLRVLVGEHGSDGFEHSWTGVILRRDHFELESLAVLLLANRLEYGGVLRLQHALTASHLRHRFVLLR